MLMGRGKKLTGSRQDFGGKLTDPMSGLCYFSVASATTMACMHRLIFGASLMFTLFLSAIDYYAIPNVRAYRTKDHQRLAIDDYIPIF